MAQPIDPSVLRIGIVHTWPMVRLGLRTSLEKTGRMVVVAEAGKGAVLEEAFPATLGVQVVLVEVKSPFKEVRQWIRWLKHERRIPVLTYGELTERVAEELADLDVNGLLPGDVDDAELHRACTVASAEGYHANPWLSSRMGKKKRRPGVKRMAGEPTDRQMEALKHFAAGLTLEETATKMGIKRRGVESLRDALFDRFGVRKISGLINEAAKRRLL